MRLKKLMTGALSVAMLGTMMCTTAFAADYTDGDYTGEIHLGPGLPACAIPSLCTRRR